MSAAVRVAVVVPVHGHPQFLAGAVTSALASELDEPGPGVVVVNDGCPFASTDRIARELRDEHPERVHYVQQPNRGVAAARNAGVREALRVWPATEAIFFLDADNRLSPGTLRRLRDVLRAHAGAGWAYPAVEFFGLEQACWQVPGAFNPYRQLFENQCDTGALVAREVFDRGVSYDETMRDGLEDWEFYVRAMRAGFAGVPAGAVGFRYRVRHVSMKTAAAARREAIREEIHDRHRELLEPRALTRLEHEHLPRFTLAGTDGFAAVSLAAADLEPSPAVTTPITVHGTPELWAIVERLRLLPGLLMRAQVALRRHPIVRLTVTRHDAPEGIALSDGGAGGEAHAVATAVVGEAHGSAPAGLVLRLGTAHAPQLPPPLPAGAVAAGPVSPRQQAAGGRTHAEFSLAKHVERLETTFPLASAARDLWLVADTLDDRLAALAEALLRLGDAAVAHLVVTGERGFDGPRERLEGFATVTLLAGAEPETAALLVARTLESAGIALIAGSAAGYDALSLVEPRLAPVRVAIVPEVERDEVGVGRDPAVQAAHEMEGLLDVVLATSRRAALQYENLEVVPDKIAVLPLDGAPLEAAGVASRAIGEAAAR